MLVFPSWSIINLFQISKYYPVPTTTRNKSTTWELIHTVLDSLRIHEYEKEKFWDIGTWSFCNTCIFFISLIIFFSFQCRTSLTYSDAVCCRSTCYWQVYHWLESHTCYKFITRSPVILSSLPILHLYWQIRIPQCWLSKDSSIFFFFFFPSSTGCLPFHHGYSSPIIGTKEMVPLLDHRSLPFPLPFFLKLPNSLLSCLLILFFTALQTLYLPSSKFSGLSSQLCSPLSRLLHNHDWSSPPHIFFGPLSQPWGCQAVSLGLPTPQNIKHGVIILW